MTHATRDQLHQLVAATPLAIAMFDRDMRYLACSRLWIQVFGAGREDLVGASHYEVHPDLPERYLVAHRAGLEGVSTTVDEDPWRVGGREIFCRWVVHPWHRADGDVGGIVITVEDVTERALAQRRLLLGEQRYRHLVDAVPVGIWVTRDERFALANPEAARLLGASSPGALLGRSLWDVVAPAGRGQVVARLASLSGGEDVPTYQTRLRGLDGVERPVEVTVQRITDEGSAAYLVFARDLSEQLRAEAVARDGEERLQGIIRSVMDGIVTVDESHRVVLANPAAEQMFGYPPGGLQGLSLDALVPATRRAAHRAAMAVFADRGAPHQTMGGAQSMLEGLHATGEVFPIETSVSKVTVGGREYYTAVHRDLAPRLRTEGALASERERFRQLAEAIREVFWLKDVASSQILYVSPAFETVWGRSTESLYQDGDAWLAAVHPDDRARVDAAIPGQVQGRYDLEYRIVRPDGTTRWVHDRAFPIADATGAVVRVAGVAEDVTQRRVLEQQVQQTQRLESMGRLAGGVAHDFNNLLTIILSSAELLREGGGVAADSVDEILDAARRGATLTRQLLAFTRQEVVEPRVVRLSSVVADAERLLRRLLGEDLELRTTTAPGGASVRVDPGQWSQLVINLAVNARDAMPVGGVLRISTYPRDADPELAARHPGASPGPWEVLEVADTGCGMSPEVQRRMFEPFFTTKGKGRGTGLGLAVVYGVVQQAGGLIEVETAEGVGTTFRIYVPRVQGTSASSAPRSESLANDPGGRERVLVVEDETAVRRVVAHVLRSKGYDVTVAADGEAALRAVDGMGAPPRILVTDVVMPGLDGAHLAEVLRVRFPTLKVLFTSGYIDETLTRRGVSGQGTGFLQKPYSPVALAGRVRELLDEADGVTP